MTYKSLFKEAAQRIVQLGQMPDPPSQPVGQVTGTGALSAGGSAPARTTTHPFSATPGRQPGTPSQSHTPEG